MSTATDTTAVIVNRAEAPQPSFALDEGGVFAITPQSPPDAVVEAINKLTLFKERLKEADKWLEEAVTEWIKCNGPLTSGPFKWYVGEVSEVVWDDVAGAAEAGLIAAGGDWQAFVRDFLASKPVKHGALEQAIGAEAASKFFRRVKVEELKDNVSTVKKKLQKMDTRYVR